MGSVSTCGELSVEMLKDAMYVVYLYVHGSWLQTSARDSSAGRAVDCNGSND